MDANDVAAQKHWDAVASQQMMCGLSDNPSQFREEPMSALFRQAEREWRAQFGDEPRDYFSMPF
jgi:hypothetical protein